MDKYGVLLFGMCVPIMYDEVSCQCQLGSLLQVKSIYVAPRWLSRQRTYGVLHVYVHEVYIYGCI